MEAVKAAFFSAVKKARPSPKISGRNIVENRIRSDFIAILGWLCLLSATIVLSAKLHYTSPIPTGVGDTSTDATKQDQACRL
jgi:hypothetical protein